MSDILVRRAIEKHLTASGWGGLDADHTFFENETREPPADGTAYQQTFLLPAQPDDPLMGAAQYMAHGVFQVSLKYPLGGGPGAAGAQAELLRSRFKRATTLTESGLNVLITDTPAVARGYEDAGRWHVPVSIRWQAWVPAT